MSFYHVPVPHMFYSVALCRPLLVLLHILPLCALSLAALQEEQCFHALKTLRFFIVSMSQQQ